MALEPAVVEPALGMVFVAVSQWRGAWGGETWQAVLGAWEVVRIKLCPVVSARLLQVRKGLEED